MHVDAAGRLQTPQPAQLAKAAGQQLLRLASDPACLARTLPCLEVVLSPLTLCIMVQHAVLHGEEVVLNHVWPLHYCMQ